MVTKNVSRTNNCSNQNPPE